MDKLILIDGNSLINRAFYATPMFVTKDGKPTNAVFGFTNMLFKLIKSENPTHICVAFDMKAPTFRHKMYSEYKGTRKPMPIELVEQIPLLKELLKKMKICILQKEGIEADDIIGTVAKSTNKQTIIITGDRDSFQLVDENTEVHFTKRGISDVDVMNNENFTQKMGFTPLQIIDYKAIAGDSSDNIPGIKGVGEKTAISLLQEYTTLENLYENVDKLKGKLQEKVIESKEMAMLSKALATIDTKADIDFDLNEMKLKVPFPYEAYDMIKKLEFKILSKRTDMFEEGSENERQETENEKVNVEIIEISTIEQLSHVSFGEDFAISFNENFAIYTNGCEYKIKERLTLFDDGLNQIEFLNGLKRVFENSEKTLYVFNKKELLYVLKDTDVVLKCKTEDVAIMKYLADFTGKYQTLAEVISENGLSNDTSAYDVYYMYKMYGGIIEAEGMKKLYYDVELPLVDVLYDMENVGFKADTVALDELCKKYETELNGLSETICGLAGEVFNINSPKKLGEILFDKLKIGKGKKNSVGYSTTAEVLEKYADDNEIVKYILRYRKIQKYKSTYAEGLKAVADKKTGLIHTRFNQMMTSTGRLSSAEPNLQNIPIRDDESKNIRKCLIASSVDNVLVSADYSQIELRLLASFSNCKTLIDAYLNGEDIHSATASKVFNVPINEVTKKQRRDAKAVNFGIIYGISEYGLSKDINVSVTSARNYINSYFEKYPEVKKYIDGNVEKARENGYVTTLMGRRRVIREIKASNYVLRMFGERAAMNMPLQGSSADIIKVAMINVYNRLKKEGLKAKLILQVHDELVVDAPKGEQKTVENILREEMQNAVQLSVPLTVDVESGENLLME